MNDAALLLRYVRDQSDSAFRELVQRHVHLVYGVALRQSQGDRHRAEEVVQQVFIVLARKARTLVRHPSLAGWLYRTAVFTARDLRRAEARRCQREQTAYTMNPSAENDGADVHWSAVRPVIDDALNDLAEDHRAVVLLRYFESRSYEEIAAILGLSPNGARMRVDRGLKKLRMALRRRGVVSTPAALASVLAIPAAVAAPAGLAPQVASAALASVVTVAGASSLFTILTIMSSTKVIITSSAAAALLAVGVAVHQHYELRQSRQDVAQLRQQYVALETRLATAAAGAAAAAPAPDATRFVGDASVAADAPAASLAPPAEPVTRDQVEQRYARARELAAAGEHAAALKEYLWCYDIGMRQVDGYFLTRYGRVVDEIAALGQHDPVALEALRLRRDAAFARLVQSPNDREAGKDFGQINRVLGENDSTIAYFELLDEDDPRRQHIIESSFARLLEAQRYRELAKAMPYEGMPKAWEDMVQADRCAAPSEAARQQRRRAFINLAARQVEFLAGAGDVIHANDMLERILVFDDSRETVATLNQHLLRAGRPDLVIPAE